MSFHGQFRLVARILITTKVDHMHENGTTLHEEHFNSVFLCVIVYLSRP